MSIPPESKNNSTNLTRGIISRSIQVVFVLILIGVILFLSAGRWDWRMGWIYIGLNFFGLIINLIVLVTKNPEVVAARSKPGKEDTKGWDKVWVKLSSPMTLLVFIVSGLDAGNHEWSIMPSWVQLLGVGLFLLSWFFSTWALASNKHFETSVRIQEDREHKTVTIGPYEIIRHPGYAAFILLYSSSSLILGSWWGLIPAGVLAVSFIFRTAREDRMLCEELPDYPAYAQKVKYRLLPGVW